MGVMQLLEAIARASKTTGGLPHLMQGSGDFAPVARGMSRLAEIGSRPGPRMEVPAYARAETMPMRPGDEPPPYYSGARSGPNEYTYTPEGPLGRLGRRAMGELDGAGLDAGLPLGMGAAAAGAAAGIPTLASGVASWRDQQNQSLEDILAEEQRQRELDELYARMRQRFSQDGASPLPGYKSPLPFGQK